MNDDTRQGARAPMSDLLHVEKVSKAYDVGGDARVEVLRQADLTMEEGDTVSIVGPSGSGKSTLLNIVGTLDRPDSGSVFLDGENLQAVEDGRLSELRSRKIGFIFQLHHLLPQCTVLENVLVPTLVVESADDAQERARALLDKVGLSHRLRHRPGQLSGGERQRVAVVRALINRPRLLLADEPTGSLDREGSERLAELLVSVSREQDVTMLVVTHSQRLADRMERRFELQDGQLVSRS